MELNEPLDRISSEANSPNSKSKIGLILELILGSCLITWIFIRDIAGFPESIDPFGLLSVCILGIAYLFGNWWLNKPYEKSARMILMTILFGFTSFTLLFAFVFRLLYLPGEPEMRIFSLILVVFASLLDTITSVHKTKVSNLQTKWRFALLAGIIVVYLFINEDKRIRFSYRNYPEFLQYYDQQKKSKRFVDIEKEYFGE